MHSKKIFLFLFLLNSIKAWAFDESLHIADLAIVNDCNSIEGSYWPDGFSQSDAPLTKKYKYPRIGWREFGMESIDEKINYVTLALDESMKFTVNVYDSNNNLLLSKKYGNESAACVNGWRISESYSKGGSGETGSIETYTRAAYARAENGYLVVHSTQKFIRRTFFFFKSEQSFEERTVYKSK